MPKPKKHKRKRPKSGRSGCIMCKPHKCNGMHEDTHAEAVRKAKADSTRE